LSAAASSCTGTTASRLLDIIWKTHGRRPRPPEIPPRWPPPRCKGHPAKSRGGLPAVARHANCLLRRTRGGHRVRGRRVGAPGNKALACDRRNTDKRAATRLLRGCIGSRRLAIRGWLSPGDRWHRRCPSKSADAHLRLRKPPPGCGRGAVDGAMTSVGSSSSATSGECRSPLMSAASKRSISAKPTRSRRT
jgi:hypothetical protein